MELVKSKNNLKSGKVVAFVPIKLNSKRCPRKNIRELGSKPLVKYILETLKKIPEIDEIYVYCSDELIVKYIPNGVQFLQRDEKLDADETLGIEIYKSFVNEVAADTYILAHATSPFITAESIRNALYMVIENNFDSSFCVQEVKNFAWYQDAPLNYNIYNIPRTQDIEPVYIETSAFFIFKESVLRKTGSRIGKNPYKAVVGEIEGIDIDTQEEFRIAEKLIM
jgi:CMP-N-acetylneuraminic acid synthetase